MNTISPLRYPGGKSKIYGEISNLINKCKFNSQIYVEPFGGGFGVGLQLLKDGYIEKAILNDYDLHIYHFWWCVFNKTNELIMKIQSTPITIEEREIQKNIYNNNSSIIDDAFATLFLNRVNFSGIIKGGPLGGYEQKSMYKIDCRFNKDDIISKILYISTLKDKIELYNFDAEYLFVELMKEKRNKYFFNIDPPYVINGKNLYTTYYIEKQHRSLSKTINKYLNSQKWILTYDDCEIVKELYSEYTIKEFVIWHSASKKAHKEELLITNIEEKEFVWRKTN